MTKLPQNKLNSPKTEKIIRQGLQKLKPIAPKKVPNRIQCNFNLSFKINNLVDNIIKFFKPSKHTSGLLQKLPQGAATGFFIGLAVPSSILLFKTVASGAPEVVKFLKSKIFTLIDPKRSKENTSLCQKLIMMDYQEYFDTLSLEQQQFCLESKVVKIWNLVYLQNFDPISFEKFFNLWFVSLWFPEGPLLNHQERKLKEKQFQNINNNILKLRGGCEEEGLGEKKEEPAVIADPETWAKLRTLITSSVRNQIKVIMQSFALFLLCNLTLRIVTRMVKLRSFDLRDVIALSIDELKIFWEYFSNIEPKLPAHVLFTSHSVDDVGFAMFRADLIYECWGQCGAAYLEALNSVKKEFNSTLAFEFLGNSISILNANALSKFYNNPFLFPDKRDST